MRSPNDRSSLPCLSIRDHSRCQVHLLPSHPSSSCLLLPFYCIFYSLGGKPFFEVVSAAAERGVDVRVLFWRNAAFAVNAHQFNVGFYWDTAASCLSFSFRFVSREIRRNWTNYMRWGARSRFASTTRATTPSTATTKKRGSLTAALCSSFSFSLSITQIYIISLLFALLNHIVELRSW